MRNGSLNRALMNALADGSIEPTHCPDGLTEADIDALIVKAFGEAEDIATDIAGEPAELPEVVHLTPAPQVSKVASDFEGEAA